MRKIVLYIRWTLERRPSYTFFHSSSSSTTQNNNRNTIPNTCGQYALRRLVKSPAIIITFAGSSRRDGTFHISNKRKRSTKEMNIYHLIVPETLIGIWCVLQTCWRNTLCNTIRIVFWQSIYLRIRAVRVEWAAEPWTARRLGSAPCCDPSRADSCGPPSRLRSPRWQGPGYILHCFMFV